MRFASVRKSSKAILSAGYRLSAALHGRAPLIEALHGTKANLTNKIGLQPSLEAVEFHAHEVFEH
jgi:hypothetical protein